MTATTADAARRIGGRFVRRDSLDLRDRMFHSTLVEVPTEIPLEQYKKYAGPVLDQGKAWACTGFALATVVHYLLRRRAVHPMQTEVSPAMLFEMARRYDDYPGEQYLGSSARGAMKGWYLHGVCAKEYWPFTGGRTSGPADHWEADAATRPLGAYLRVNHKDLVAMHCALAEVGVLYAVANIHEGWIDDPHYWDWVQRPVREWPRQVLPGGEIRPFRREGRRRIPNEPIGSHAFAIVAFNERGFWIQNSFGTRWGKQGYGFLPYDDWLRNGVDVWVARLGVPVRLDESSSTARVTASAGAESRMQTIRELRPHLVRIHNDGHLLSNDAYGTTIRDLDALLGEHGHFMTTTRTWRKKRLLLYAGGEVFSLNAAVQRGVADYRASLLREQVYPLAFIWRTGFWEIIGRVLQRAVAARRPDSAIDADTDFLLDRLDDALEPLAREHGGKLHWDEMKRTARDATKLRDGGVRMTLERIAALVRHDPSIEVHVLAHSAGSLLMAPAIQLLTSSRRRKITSGPMKGSKGLGVPVRSCTLWAPACTKELFEQTYVPALRTDRASRLLLVTLTDDAELADNCAGIYDKSLLYLISSALEDRARNPEDDYEGASIVGMAKFLADGDTLAALRAQKGRKPRSVEWLTSPAPLKSAGPTARRHGDFDDDEGTLLATLRTILGRRPKNASFVLNRSASAWQKRRQSL